MIVIDAATSRESDIFREVTTETSDPTTEQIHDLDNQDYAKTITTKENYENKKIR